MKPEEYYAMHQQSFRCAFDFLNTHFPPQDEPDWWVGASNDARKASASVGEGKLVNGLLIGIMDYLEHECKERRKNDGKTDN